MHCSIVLLNAKICLLVWPVESFAQLCCAILRLALVGDDDGNQEVPEDRNIDIFFFLHLFLPRHH
jgi:hypothetical protein